MSNKVRIEITKKDLVKVYSILNILESGVEKVYLEKTEDSDELNVDADYKNIVCRNVKVKSISDKGMLESKTATKNRIEGSIWSFPCPDYKYDNIKRNLENSICELLKIQNCSVSSFSTDIVEY